MSDAVAATYALERSVDDLYAVFAAYDVGSIAFCPQCHTQTAALVAALREAEPRALAATDVAEFFANVFTSALASEGTFKALLPRVLELATPGADDIAHLSVATFGQKLAQAGWTSWPTVESAAVDAWARAWFAATLACGDSHGTALDDVLSALGSLYDDLAPFLTRLRTSTDARERRQSAHLVLTVCFALSYARSALRDDWSCIGAGWRKGSRPERQMLTWLATYASYEDVMADATATGCACSWVAMCTAGDVNAAFATFAWELTEPLRRVRPLA